MRFNQEDLRRGSVSQERMKEIVLQTVYKLDNSKGEAEQLQRIGSKLLSDVEKIFLFKKSEGHEKEDLEKYNYELNLSNLQFFDKLIRANLQLIRTERMIEFVVQQELQKVIQEKTIELKLMNEQKRMSEINYQAQMAQIISQQLQQLAQQRSDSLHRLQDLISHRNQLVESIQEHKQVIQASREVHQTEALKHVHEVKVGEVNTFEGMTPENQKKWVNGYFALEEILTRKDAEIDHKIKIKMDELAKNGGDNRKTSGLVHNFQNKSSKLWAEIEQLKAEKTQNYKEFRKAVDRLGDETGHPHIHSKAKDSDAHLSAFQNHSEIKKHIEAHKEVTKDQTEKILVAKEEIVIANLDIKAEAKNTKEIISQRTELIKNNSEFLHSDEIDKLNKSIDEEMAIKKQLEAELEASDLDDAFKNIDISSLSDLDVDFASLDLDDLDIDGCQLDQLGEDIPDLNGLDFEDLDLSTPSVASKESPKVEQANRQMKSS